MINQTYDVIYMDDDPMMTELFNQFVGWRYQQWRVNTYTDPLVLHKQIRSGEVNARVWVIDIMMPKINGAELASEIRALYGVDVPVLGYTALERSALDADEQYRQGLHHFTQIVRKNEGIARLLDIVDNFLQGQAGA